MTRWRVFRKLRRSWSLLKTGFRSLPREVIGFYMERAGYDEQALTHLRKLGVGYDFYLDYGMKEKDFSKEWRIYYPKELKV